MTKPTFRTAVASDPGGPHPIEVIEAPLVEPGAGQIRVRVAGASVNPVDVAVAGGYFHSLGLIDQPVHTGLGWDFAGTVAAAGSGVDLPVGARVAGLVPGFDRDFGPYAEQIVVPASDVAVVPDALELTAAATVPLNGLTAAQMVDLLGDPVASHDRLLVTGAAGAVGAYVVSLAQDRGWHVTGLARAADEDFVRGLGADFVTRAEPGWDAVADGAVMQGQALALVRDGGLFVGTQPSAPPASERDIDVAVVNVRPDARTLGDLLARTADGELPARVHATITFDQIGEAHRAIGQGGVRGRYVLRP